jgi:two-component system response regulator FixJ
MKHVTVIDDDLGVLEAVGMVLETKGFAVSRFPSAEEFLSAPAQHGCIISDLRMPGLNGMELLKTLKAADDPRSVILLTAHGDIQLAVQALKMGAFDFIEKPFDEARLVDAATAASEASASAAIRHAELSELQTRYDSLTERRKQVMWLIVAGHSNKEVAARLGISVRTVETHRAWILERMRTRTLSELVRASMQLRDSGEFGLATTPAPTHR